MSMPSAESGLPQPYATPMPLSYLTALLFRDPLIILSTAGFGFYSLLISFSDPDGKRQHRTARAWARSLTRIAGARVSVSGTENVDPSRNYVFACNHLSYMDIPMILPHIPVDFRFMAKAGLWKIPLLGHHLERAGHLPVVFDDPRASVRTMKSAANVIQDKKLSIVIFPEGGRAKGPLEDFKEGVAYIAITAGVPIVPMSLSGSREVLPMGSLHVRPNIVRIRFGKPVETAGTTLKDRKEITTTVRLRVAELLGGQDPAA
jgi:1-acyl-sn-glycerol-3-phosphate acyltransferase